MEEVITYLAHNLDDFILLVKVGPSECQRRMQMVLEECAALEVPLARHKLEGPSESLNTMFSDKVGTQSSVRINQVSLFPLQGVLLYSTHCSNRVHHE